MSRFKKGDKVYCPLAGNKILEVDYCSDEETLFIAGDYCVEFDKDGEALLTNLSDEIYVRSVFHATAENKQALEILYGIEFEEA